MEITMPTYKVLAAQLPAVVHGGGSKYTPSKFLILYTINNLVDAMGTMNLLIYPASNHGHYGRGITDPIEPEVLNTTSTLNKVQMLVLGHNEIITENLVISAANPKYNFHYLILTPKKIDMVDHKTHLCFQVKAYDINDKEIMGTAKASILAISDSHPSPPADAGQ